MIRRVLLVTVLATWAGCFFAPSPPGDDDVKHDASVVDAAHGDGNNDDDAAVIDGAPTDGRAIDARPIDARPIDAAVDAPTDAAIDAAIDAPIDAPAMPTGRTLVIDTAADFNQGNPPINEAFIDPAGRMEPRAYYYGGLCTGGSNIRLFMDGNTADGSTLPAQVATGLARFTNLDVVTNGLPHGVSITAPDDWTYWLVGEVFLSQGNHTLTLFADKAGFLELAPIGVTTSFTKLIGANVTDGEKSAQFNATAAGWYGIRYALSQSTGTSDLYVKVDGQFLSRYVTRCRADVMAGLAEVVGDEGHGIHVVGTTMDVSPQVANRNWAFGGPTDLGLNGNDTWSNRWSGQVRIDVGGVYTFRLDTDDGQRMWIDGIKVLNMFDNAAHNLITQQLNLAQGWHDIVVEQTEEVLGAKAILVVNSGPELSGVVIPPSRFRPAEARTERIEAVNHDTTFNFPAIDGFTVTVPTGATVTGVDVGYLLNINTPAALTVNLSHGAITSQLRAAGSMATTDRVNTNAFNSLDPNGVWNLSYTTSGGVTGQAIGAWLTIHYTESGRKGPIADTSAMITNVRDLLAGTGLNVPVTQIGPIHLTTLPAAGSTILAYVRTCPTANTCTGPWAGPYGDGATPAVPLNRYAQFLFAISTDTDHAAWLDKFVLDYKLMGDP